MLRIKSGVTQDRRIGSLCISFIGLGVALTLFGLFTHRMAAQTMTGDFTGVHH